MRNGRLLEEGQRRVGGLVMGPWSGSHTGGHHGWTTGPGYSGSLYTGLRCSALHYIYKLLIWAGFARSYSLIIDDRLSYYWSPKYSVTYCIVNDTWQWNVILDPYLLELVLDLKQGNRKSVWLNSQSVLLLFVTCVYFVFELTASAAYIFGCFIAPEGCLKSRFKTRTF